VIGDGGCSQFGPSPTLEKLNETLASDPVGDGRSALPLGDRRRSSGADSSGDFRRCGAGQHREGRLPPRNEGWGIGSARYAVYRGRAEPLGGAVSVAAPRRRR
jgi:hypothetical protein